MGLFTPKGEDIPPHPRQEPRFEGDLTADHIRFLFQDCADFGERTVLIGGDPAKLRRELRRADNLTETILAYARLRFTTETPEACVRVFRGYLEGSAAPGEFTRGLYERGVE